MAKELPYFKFEPSQWENGNVQMCSDIAKLHFINICSAYWSRLGDLSDKFALIRCCSNNEKTFSELIDSEIISVENGKIIVKFLDKQLSEFFDVSKARSESGRKGGQNGGVRPKEERLSGKQIYLLYCANNDESFLKLGTTSNSISRRYSGKMPYQYEVLFQHFSDDYIDLEDKLTEKFSDFSHIPKLNFQGQKECYSISYLEQIKKELEQLDSVAEPTLKRSEAIREEKKRVNKNREDKKQGLHFPFSSPEFFKVWDEIIIQPKWKKKSQSALQKSLDMLSRYPEQIAIEMMNNSIANDWQGLFEIKTSSKSFQISSGQQNGQKSIVESMMETRTSTHAMIDKIYGEQPTNENNSNE